MHFPPTFTAFAGERCVASGPIHEVISTMKEVLEEDEGQTILVFEDRTGDPIDFDLRGTTEEALARLPAHPRFASEDAVPKRGPGRPKLGVVSREVSLLPRHWEWLEEQRGGISVALRALVEEARKRHPSSHLARKAREAAGKFMWTMAGNLPCFEDASRALYAGDDEEVRALTRAWPEDIRGHVLRLLDRANDREADATT
jgi:hypothetical protein